MRAFLAVALIIVLCGCGSPTRIDLTVPWQDGETSVYQISQKNEPIGTLRLSVADRDGAWVIHSVTEVEDFLEEITVEADQSLVPSQTEFFMRSGETEVTYEALYGEDKVTISAQRPDGPQSAVVKLPSPPYYDNEQFLMLVRALPLQDDWESSVNLIVTRTATKTVLALKVLEKEQVKTPAGLFEAWKVELKGAGQFAWVEVKAPHRLVKYANVKAETVSLLTDYSRD